MHLTGLDLFFWAASFLGHVVLLFVLWKRHRAKLIPVLHNTDLDKYCENDCAVHGHALRDQGQLLLHLLVACSARYNIATVYRLRDGFPCLPPHGGVGVRCAEELLLAVGSERTS